MKAYRIGLCMASMIFLPLLLAKGQVLPTPQAPPQKLVVLIGEPCQMHIPGNGEIWAAQIVRVHPDNRADLVVWESGKRSWNEHHGIALDRGAAPNDPFYTLFR